MAIYICYLLLAGIQVPFFYYTEKTLNSRRFDAKKYLTLCCAELVLLAGIRGYTIGADTERYLRAIDYYSNFSGLELLRAKLVWPFDFEIGYFTLTKLSILLGLGKTGFLFVVALLTYIPVFSAIKKYSPMPYLSILCYFAFGMFVYSLGLFRQMIAISIVLCGWEYVQQRRLIRYMLTVCLAMSFHTTAVVAMLIYILYGIKWERVIWSLVGVECALVVLGRPIVLLAIRLLPQYAGYVGGKYDLQGGSYSMLLFLNIALFASVMYRNKRSQKDSMVICALVLAVCMQAVGYSMAIFGRIVPYFSIYIIFAIPNVICGMNHENRKVVSVATVLILLLLTFLQFDGNQYVTPYYTVFNEILN